MKPSSSPFEPVFPWRLDAEWLRAMLDAEAALARAQAQLGMVPDGHADEITGACRRLRPDPEELARSAAEAGTPVVPLVRAIRSAVSPGAAEHVHQGATSQDVIDTAAMLLASRALRDIAVSVDQAADAAAALAAEHKHTPMAGRTLLRQAAPTTFGALAAGWLSALDRTRKRVGLAAEYSVAVQLGGAVGTLASLGDRGLDVLSAFAAQVGLPEPDLPWHTDRSRIAELAGVLGQVTGVAGKIGRDVVLLSQTEIGEVREATRPGRGTSSALPHKQNPVAAVSVQAAAAQAPGLVATLLGAMSQDLQRAPGAWQGEWAALAQLLTVSRSATAWLSDCLGGLEVDVRQMRRNLDLTDGLVTAEQVTAVLGLTLGRRAAEDLVSSACQEAVADRRSLLDILDGREELGLPRSELARLLDPTKALGTASSFVDRALRAHAARVAAGARPSATSRSRPGRQAGSG